MSQTLLALVALLITMQISLVNQRSILNARVTMVDNELETIATGAALDILDYIGTKPFDEATATGFVSDAEDLTPLPFPTGGTYEEAEDIDDFNGIQTYVYDTDIDDVGFSAEIEVRYVDEDDITQVSVTPTFSKEVVLTITHPNLEQPVVLNRVYSYP
ncbi:hypothetical protein [Rhodocaloribacter sp.]